MNYEMFQDRWASQLLKSTGLSGVVDQLACVQVCMPAGTTCVACDAEQHHELIEIIAMNLGTIAYITPMSTMHHLQKDSPMACLGTHGSLDLEVSQPGITTIYDFVHVNTGHF